MGGFSMPMLGAMPNIQQMLQQQFGGGQGPKPPVPSPPPPPGLNNNQGGNQGGNQGQVTAADAVQNNQTKPQNAPAAPTPPQPAQPGPPPLPPSVAGVMNQGPGPNANQMQGVLQAGTQQALQGQQMDMSQLMANPAVQNLLASFFGGSM